MRVRKSDGTEGTEHIGEVRMPKQRDARKPEQTVTAVEFRASLGELLSRVGFGNERIAITRDGKKIAVLVSARDLEALDGAA
jgi:prevent-host-death family protein